MRHILIVLLLILTSLGYAADRHMLRLPDIEGYHIVKCDLHNHTVFSDGLVWPDFRILEAWVTGLDALAITDHIEYLPHSGDISADHNRSYDLARKPAQQAGIILIKGSEITRDMPPGHFNALFLTDSNALDTETWQDAIQAAYDQDAFIIWNHPGWKGQQPDGIARWYDEHEGLVQKGMLHGIEVVNSNEYYPEAHQWCLDKQLTMIGTSDIHGTIAMEYNQGPDDHRPMTWVLVEEVNKQSIKHALMNQQTLVYWRDQIIGLEKYVRPFFKAAVEIKTPAINRRTSRSVEIANPTDLPFELELLQSTTGVSAPARVTLKPGTIQSLSLGFDKQESYETIELQYEVTNLRIAPDSGLSVSWEFTVIE